MRTAILSRNFENELSEIEPDAVRADEFVRAAGWVLCRSPISGIKIRQSDIWFCPMHESIPDWPLFVIYYTFDETNVHFLSIQISG